MRAKFLSAAVIACGIAQALPAQKAAAIKNRAATALSNLERWVTP